MHVPRLLLLCDLTTGSAQILQLCLLVLRLYTFSLLTCVVEDIAGLSANLRCMALPYGDTPLDTTPMVSAKAPLAAVAPLAETIGVVSRGLTWYGNATRLRCSQSAAG